MQECEKEGGRKSLATVALILSKLLPPHTLTSSHPHHLTPSSPIAHPVSLTASHVHNVPLPPSLHNLPPLTPSPLTPSHHPPPCTTSHPSHHHPLTPPSSMHNLPPLTPSPLTSSHHPPPCTPSHCTHAHEQPRYLNRSKMESTVPSCVTCPVEALLHVRSIGYRLPGRMVITTNTPNATSTTVRARGCEVVHWTVCTAERARHFGVEPTAPRALDSRPGGRSPSPRSRPTSSPCRRRLHVCYVQGHTASILLSTLGRA